MRWHDLIHYAVTAMVRFRMRSVLILVAMSIGVSSMLVLTSLGEGARRYVIAEFASLGTNLLIVLPGKSETQGIAASLFVTETTRDLTVADAVALQRLSRARLVSPLSVGSATVSWQQRDRDAPVIGSTRELLEIRLWKMAQGQFLPPGDPERSSAVCVIGANLKRELFANSRALGEWIRIGDRRYRVIGVLASEGRSIGVDVQDVIIIPVAAAQTLFNTRSLFRILVEATSRESLESLKQQVIQLIKTRHQGEEDITAITQDAVLETFDRILGALTMAVAGIAAISLVVAGILIMNVMLVAVSQRTAEIGLLKALGANRRQVVLLFMTEAALLSLVGASIGIVIGMAGSGWLRYAWPDIPFVVPYWALLSSVLIALLTGLVFGVMPARRAARQDPVISLARRM